MYLVFRSKKAENSRTHFNWLPDSSTSKTTQTTLSVRPTGGKCNIALSGLCQFWGGLPVQPRSKVLLFTATSPVGFQSGCHDDNLFAGYKSNIRWKSNSIQQQQWWRENIYNNCATHSANSGPSTRNNELFFRKRWGILVMQKCEGGKWGKDSMCKQLEPKWGESVSVFAPALDVQINSCEEFCEWI